jgi:putative methyltransferase
MPEKHRLALVSVNNAYGENVYLPLTSGLLWASARMDRSVTDEYEEPIFLYKKESVIDALKALGDPLPDVVAFSCYIWNWEWNRSLAKAIKQRKRSTQVVFGGVHVPDLPEKDWFSRFPEVDFLLHGEGEASFTAFLKEYSNERNWPKVPGLSAPDFTTERRSSPLEAVGSPYLDGVFDSLLPRERRWQVLQETNRGCPYSCTFCEWGASALNKIRAFPLDRVLQEIDWFGSNHIDYIDNADANFGILPRDEEIAEALIRAKEQYGYPTKFRTSFAKYSNPTVAERVFRISKALNRAGQLKAVTLALQSTNSETMDSIKRKNIAMSDFSTWQKRYRSEGIPTYTELILGLPGETIASFLDGIDQVLDSGQHEGIFIYLCTLLPNSEMANPEYIDRHGLKSVRMRAMLTHGTPARDVPDEWQDTVVETATMRHESWLEAYLVAWAIQVFHSCGLTTWWAREQRKAGLKYSTFYLELINLACDNRGTVLWTAWNHTRKLVMGALGGEPWTNVLPRFGEISWPPDEGGFLIVAADLDRFYSEMEVLGMPSEQRRHGPPCIPVGHEKDYAQQVWYGRRGAFLHGLRDLVDRAR